MARQTSSGLARAGQALGHLPANREEDKADHGCQVCLYAEAGQDLF